MTKVLFAAPDVRWLQYQDHLQAAFEDAGLDVDLARDHPPADVDYMIYAPAGGPSDFGPYTALKAVLSIWAGVEDIVGNPTLRVPLARMVDPGLAEGMVEWVTGHVLRYHLGIDRTLRTQSGVWDRYIPPLARERRVGVLGLGALGTAVSKALLALNFDVEGWARRPKSHLEMTCHSGEAGLVALLNRSEIVVLLLPSTPDTQNVINAKSLSHLPAGACLINPGRGQLIDDDALLAALDAGTLAHATLDVFREEPLPAAHPYWAHPKVTVTPHIAADTRPLTAARVIAENVRRGEAGEPYINIVDRTAGY